MFPPLMGAKHIFSSDIHHPMREEIVTIVMIVTSLAGFIIMVVGAYIAMRYPAFYYIGLGAALVGAAIFMLPMARKRY